MTTKKQAIGYIRVSSGSQEANTRSIETQYNLILKYCNEREYDLIECCKDTASGASLDRPGIREVIEHCHNEEFSVDLIVATEPSRVSRSVSEVIQLVGALEHLGTQIEFADEEVTDKAFFRVDDPNGICIGWTHLY